MMETIEYRTVDKSTWGEGAWQQEPDKRQWQDPATGLPCLIVRGPSGALCGYVGVSEAHPFYKREYCDGDSDDDRRPDNAIEAHGGLTFSESCAGGDDESRGICHKPGDGEPDHVWWFGFDCAHAGDLCPRTDSLRTKLKQERIAEWPTMSAAYMRETYRDFPYVETQVAKMAQQLAAIA